MNTIAITIAGHTAEAPELRFTLFAVGSRLLKWWWRGTEVAGREVLLTAVPRFAN